MSKSIEELQEEIDELTQIIDDHNNELSNHEECGYDRAMLEMEGKIEHAFKAGYNDKYTAGHLPSNDLELIKSLLNYQMEQRL
ncbi:MAG TPA: hypothetical protein EYN51_03430 [Flavobacteriales bacterium]|nr:hypothetical protein [Flavobacteriales bacterium]